MINDERIKTIADSGNAMQCEVSELATELLTLRAEVERLRGAEQKLRGIARMIEAANQLSKLECRRTAEMIREALTPTTKE